MARVSKLNGKHSGGDASKAAVLRFVSLSPEEPESSESAAVLNSLGVFLPQRLVCILVECGTGRRTGGDGAR